MASKCSVSPSRRGRNESPTKHPIFLPDVALAAIFASNNQEQVNEFITFFLQALARNSVWVNKILEKSNYFKCALMQGAGPNRFKLIETIYPNLEGDIKLEVQVKEHEDHDKIAIAALTRMATPHLKNAIEFVRNRLGENKTLQEDLLRGRSMGVHFAVLKPIDDKHYRIVERLVIDNCPTSNKKRDKSMLQFAPKRARKV